MIQIVTDSTSDLPRDVVAQLGIQVVPLRVLFGEETFRDGVDLTSDEFFDRLKASPVLPTTSQPPPADFERVFRSAVEQGNEVICMVISAKLSGTYASAMTAKESFPDARITVIDSRTTSMALGMIAEEAARMAMRGASHEEIVARVEELLPLTHVYFVVDTLEYLQKGGRIGGAQAFLGTLLNIKPLLTLRDGIVDAMERVRTKRRALDRMLEIVRREAEATGYPYRIGVLHGQAPNDAAYLAHRVRELINCVQVRQSQVGPVLGTHVGPGVVGMAIQPVLPEKG